MTRRKKMVERVTELMDKPEQIRNIGIVAHIDHGKTTLSDNLLAGAGMISEELAGRQLFMDSDEEEQARGITIDASNVSMVHEYDGKEYLINMIDTPGHVDFTYEVSRALKSCEGALLLIDVAQLFERIRQTPALAMHLIGTLSQRLIFLLKRVEQLAIADIRERFIGYLRALDDKRRTGVVQLPASKREIALLLGTTPETFSRLLKKLSDERLIRGSGRTIQLLPGFPTHAADA